MDDRAFDNQMRFLFEAMEHQRFPEALALARAMKREVLAESSPDPIQLGWARFYELKSLHAGEDWQGGYDLVTSTEPAPFAMTLKNGAWSYSVGAECAMHLGLPDEVVRLAGLCLDARERQGDTSACFMAADTACHLLAAIHREDLNDVFALDMLRRAREYGSADGLVQGYRHLLATIGKSARTDLIQVATDRPRELHGLFGKVRSASELFDTIAALENTAWWRESIGEDGRKRLVLEKTLWLAAETGDHALVSSTLREGADANARQAGKSGIPTPLMAAAFLGHGCVVDLLLGHGVDLEIPNAQDRTALIQAADEGYTDIVRSLLAKGARPNHRDFCGQTALHVSAGEGHADTVAVLLTAGADPNVTDISGYTPLCHAAGKACLDIVVVLLDHGADLHAITNDGHTPLMLAAMEGQTEIARLLLARGADPGTTDQQGMTALAWATREKHEETTRVLRG